MTSLLKLQVQYDDYHVTIGIKLLSRMMSLIKEYYVFSYQFILMDKLFIFIQTPAVNVFHSHSAKENKYVNKKSLG